MGTHPDRGRGEGMTGFESPGSTARNGYAPGASCPRRRGRETIDPVYPGQPPPNPYGIQHAYPAQPTYLQCRMCGYVGQPTMVERVSVAGWIVFSFLLLLCLPLFWIGLLIKDRRSLCPRCGSG